jgi:hypothetical protein
MHWPGLSDASRGFGKEHGRETREESVREKETSQGAASAEPVAYEVRIRSGSGKQQEKRACHSLARREKDSKRYKRKESALIRASGIPRVDQRIYGCVGGHDGEGTKRNIREEVGRNNMRTER